MEGFVDVNEYGMFLAGAVAISDKEGRVGIGISAKVQIPNDIKNKIKQGQELGPIIKDLMEDEDNSIRQSAGTNGVLTGGLYNRVDEFRDATACALAPFISPELFNK
jgi:non-canonical (house-cleaning) NTP pyrophosphatase